ncbi:MAG: hypothetical protein U0904_02515 [Candidatus Nanopelagicales bacterium]|nr:hypothetical protein [Candidatus Nanopelagicales bacterium]
MGRSRAGRWLAIVVVIVLVGAVGACSSSPPEPSPSESWTPDSGKSGEPYAGAPWAIVVADNAKLSTKCGIRFFRIKGTTWETSEVFENEGGPPPGWPTPYARGRVIVTGLHFWDAERGFGAVEPGDAIIFLPKHNPDDVIRFDLTTKTPPPCP